MALYPNNLKNRDFDEEVPQHVCLERATIADRQPGSPNIASMVGVERASEDKHVEGKPTLSKTDSSGCSGIDPYIELYEDWRWDAVGELAIDHDLRQAFKEIGFSLRRWDREAHLPWLTKWKDVRSWKQLKERLGWGLPRKEVLEEDTAYLIFCGIGLYLKNLDLGRIPKEKMILFTWEPPTVEKENWEPRNWQLFQRIYTWNDDLVDGVRFFKFYLPYLSFRTESPPPYEGRRFLTFITSLLGSKHPQQKYSERDKLIRYFEARPEIEFDLYGRFWAKRRFRCWKGTIPDKKAVLQMYRFAFAYENTHANGYITEKLWDCFAAGVVPIYWGAPNVERYVPKDCFIDRRAFKNEDELVLFLQQMTKEEWEGYIRRAGEFLETDTAKLFTSEHYLKTVVEAVQNPSS